MKDGYECMKGALINKTTNQIALMSCLNKIIICRLQRKSR